MCLDRNSARLQSQVEHDIHTVTEEGGREGGRKRGREEEREGGRKGGRKKGGRKKGGREGGRKKGGREGGGQEKEKGRDATQDIVRHQEMTTDMRYRCSFASKYSLPCMYIQTQYT